MAVPLHTLDIFQRPKEGSGFQKRITALNYQHSIVSMGWFDTMSCDIAVRNQAEGQNYLNSYLGCRVFAYADNPSEPIWEGYINRMTFNSGGASFTISLDELANRVSVKYANDSVAVNGAGTHTETAVVNSLTSQGLYAIKQATIDFGYNRNGNAGHPNALRDTILAQRAFPQTSITQGGGNTNLVHVECLGFFHTLEWEMFSISTTAATAFDVRVKTDVLGGLANATTFLDNADFTDITTNATATSGTLRNATAWETIEKVAEGGDSTNYWIAGIKGTNPQTGKRRLYYKQVNAATQYTARQADGLRIRNLYGKLVEPWSVTPDQAVLVTDVLVGYQANVSTDPRLTYIFTINYDANSQMVTWAGSDNTSAVGAFMLKRGFKPYGRSFGAALRQAAN